MLQLQLKLLWYEKFDLVWSQRCTACNFCWSFAYKNEITTQKKQHTNLQITKTLNHWDKYQPWCYQQLAENRKHFDIVPALFPFSCMVVPEPVRRGRKMNIGPVKTHLYDNMLECLWDWFWEDIRRPYQEQWTHRPTALLNANRQWRC